jgi:hypothetical protein
MEDAADDAEYPVGEVAEEAERVSPKVFDIAVTAYPAHRQWRRCNVWFILTNYEERRMIS